MTRASIVLVIAAGVTAAATLATIAAALAVLELADGGCIAP